MRRYIAAARNERFEPDTFTDEQLNADAFEVQYCSIHWDEPAKIAKSIYKVFGYTGSDQYKRGIVEQPGRVMNWLICAELRSTYGDISNVPGFDIDGNLKRERYNDVLIPVWDDKRIIRIDAFATRQLEKAIQ